MNYKVDNAFLVSSSLTMALLL